MGLSFYLWCLKESSLGRAAPEWSRAVKGSAERGGPGWGVRCWPLLATASHRALRKGSPAAAVQRAGGLLKVTVLAALAAGHVFLF